MIKFICIYSMRDFFSNSCFRHIQSFELVVSGCIFTHTN